MVVEDRDPDGQLVSNYSAYYEELSESELNIAPHSGTTAIQNAARALINIKWDGRSMNEASSPIFPTFDLSWGF